MSLRIFAMLGASLALISCATAPRVFTDFDPQQDFSDYKSFSWISAEPITVIGEQGPNPLTIERLKHNVEQAIAAKGFQLSDKIDADFVVGLSVGARDKIEVREVEVVDYFGPHWRWGHDYFGVVYHPRGFTRTESIQREYAEGILSIDIFDNKRKSPVWHASASKRLTEAELRGESAESTKLAVEQMLANFPPQLEEGK